VDAAHEDLVVSEDAMERVISVGEMFRRAEVSSANAETRTVDLVWTTGAKV
jgi:hypothetical protein